MKIEIEQINCIIPIVTRHLIIGKTVGLGRLFNGIESCNIIVEHKEDNENQNKSIKITLKVPQDTLVAKDKSKTFELALDMVIDELKKQLKRYKAKKSKTEEYATAWEKVEENSLD
jgi:ribosomal subunit interface protein